MAQLKTLELRFYDRGDTEKLRDSIETEPHLEIAETTAFRDPSIPLIWQIMISSGAQATLTILITSIVALLKTRIEKHRMAQMIVVTAGNRVERIPFTPEDASAEDRLNAKAQRLLGILEEATGSAEVDISDHDSDND